MKGRTIDFLNWLLNLNFGKYEYRDLIIAFAAAGILIFIATLVRRFYWRRKVFTETKIIRPISYWPSWPGESFRVIVHVFVYGVLAILLLEPINKAHNRLPIYEPAFIAVGIDGSMSMLAKAAPNADRSRLQVARDQIESIVLTAQQEGGSDKLLLFTFTGEAFRETIDFTNDYAIMFLPRLELVDDFAARAWGQGTDLSKALEFCGKIFPKTNLQKICFIFTDGELEGPDLRALDTAFQSALTEWQSKNKDIKVYFIAVGSSEKAEQIYKVDRRGNFTDELELNDKNKPIETKVRPDYLRAAAQKAGAGFAHVKYSSDPNPVIVEVLKKEKKIIDYKTTEKIDDVSEGFNIAYIVGLLILLVLI